MFHDDLMPINDTTTTIQTVKTLENDTVNHMEHSES